MKVSISFHRTARNTYVFCHILSEKYICILSYVKLRLCLKYYILLFEKFTLGGISSTNGIFTVEGATIIKYILSLLQYILFMLSSIIPFTPPLAL